MGWRCRQGLWRTLAFAFEGQSVSIVSEAVEGGGAEQAVGEGVAPLGEVEVGGHDGGGLFIALGEQVMEVFILGRAKRFESEVIDDQDVDAGQGVELALEGLDGVERAEQLGLGVSAEVILPISAEVRIPNFVKSGDVIARAEGMP